MYRLKQHKASVSSTVSTDKSEWPLTMEFCTKTEFQRTTDDYSVIQPFAILPITNSGLFTF